MITTERLVLTPLRVADASQMVEVLSDPSLYEFTGGYPPTIDELEARYGAQVAGPERPDERWHNWVVRLVDSPIPVGFVQATVTATSTQPGTGADIGTHPGTHPGTGTDADPGLSADVAWLTGTAWQRHGIAREAATAMCQWLRAAGVRRVTAHIHPSHAASAAVAAACGLHPTARVDDDGEVVWEWAATEP